MAIGPPAPGFGKPRWDEDYRLVLPFRASEADSAPDGWDCLCDLWLSLPAHPNGLTALGRGTDGTLLLRYAAINWSHPPLHLRSIFAQARAQATLARWGLQLIEYFRAIVPVVDESRLAELARPFMHIDLGEHVRVGFRPLTPFEMPELPPELHRRRGRCDERIFVFAVGRLLNEMCSELAAAPRLHAIVERCLEKKAYRRFRNVDDLRDAWKELGVGDAVRVGPELEEWQLVEDGFGSLALGNVARAANWFSMALSLNPTSVIARDALNRVQPPLVLPAFHVKREFGWPTVRRGQSSWEEVADRALQREIERDFRGALELYDDVRLDGTHDVALYLAVARCNLALGNGGIAVDYAERVLSIDTADVFALALRARGLLLHQRLPDALAAADTWIAAYPQDATAHHVRGRALLALARYDEARAAFDRACLLVPDLVEAQLLRREADRAMRLVRDSVGTQPPLELALPEHLAHLRDALAAGRIGEVIAELARPEHARDPIANLVHARCLAFERRFDESLALLDRVAAGHPDHSGEAAIEKAHVLLALDRAAEALALFELSSDDRRAIEGRVLALRKLGRDREADEQLARALAAPRAPD